MRGTCHCGAVVLEITLSDGLNTARRCDCSFCSRRGAIACGIYTHHQRRSNPNEYGVNIAILEGINPRDLGEVSWADGVNHPADR